MGFVSGNGFSELNVLILWLTNSDSFIFHVNKVDYFNRARCLIRIIYACNIMLSSVHLKVAVSEHNLCVFLFY